MDPYKQIESLLWEIRSTIDEIETGPVNVKEYIDSLKLTLTIDQAAKYLTCSRAKIDKMKAEGYFWTVKIGEKRYLTLQSVKDIKERYRTLKYVRLKKY